MSRKTKRNGKPPVIKVDFQIGHTEAGEVVMIFNQPVASLRMNYEQAGNIAKQLFENAKAACMKVSPPPAIILTEQRIN